MSVGEVGVYLNKCKRTSDVLWLNGHNESIQRGEMLSATSRARVP